MNQIVFVLTVIGLLLAGCAAQSPTTPNPATQTPALAPANAPLVSQRLESKGTPTLEPTSVSSSGFAALPGNLANGEPAPGFTVTTLAGETFTLSDHRGSPVLLTFMAIGCPSCMYEITSLAEAYPAHAGRGLVILVVDIQGSDTSTELQPYIDSLPYPEVSWTIDGELRVAPLYDVFNLGVTVLVDPTGRIVYRDNQPTDPDGFQQLLELALPE